MSKLINLYEKSFGKPGSLIELKGGKGADFQIAVSLPEPKKEITETRITSLGLSELSKEDELDIELLLITEGEVSPEEVEATGAFFHQLYKMIKKTERVRSGEIYRTDAVPGFGKMDAVIILNSGYKSPEWLDEAKHKAQLIKVVPLFSDEADQLEKLAVESRELFIYKSQLPFREPGRKKTKIIYDAVFNIWSAISEWYTENKAADAKKLADMLAAAPKKGAGEALEKKLGIDIPEDFKESFNIVHDTLAVGSYYLYSQSNLVAAFKRMYDMNENGDFVEALEKLVESPEFQPVWWHENWIPIAADSAGDLLVLDMQPTMSGAKGQVLKHSAVEGPEITGNHCFLDWLNDYYAGLQTGKYDVDEDGILTRK